MRNNKYSNKSAYGYQHSGTKSSSYLKSKRTFPIKWVLVGVFACCLLGGGTYLLTNFLQSSDIQNTNEEVRNMNVSVTGEEKVKADWEKEINKIQSADSDNLNKYGQVIQFAVNYKVTDREYKRFKEDVVESFEKGSYLETDEESMLTNIFKSYVLNEYTSKETDLDFKLFVSNYNQSLAYVYREYEVADSDFVKDKEAVMDSSLEKLKDK